VEYLRFAVHPENIGGEAHFGPARRGPGTDSGGDDSIDRAGDLAGMSRLFEKRIWSSNLCIHGNLYHLSDGSGKDKT
jgi:hypothetical protein